MSEVIKQPYEISIWEDITVTSSDGETYYKENKIATIGSNTMTSPNRAFDPVLTENVNGEVSFSFSIRHRYFDPYLNEKVENKFVPYLVNERKVKLKFDNKWYDFVIKECEETSEEYIFTYTADGLFPLELSKVGYNLEFNTELNNNQGTVIELARQTLKSTDWEVDEENSDILKQTVKEPVYKCVVSAVPGANTKIINVDTDEEINLVADEVIYVFYSYITERKGQFVQFIRESDRDNFILDSDKVVTSTNYRFVTEVEIDKDKTTITNGDGLVIDIEEIFDEFQAYRLVYSQLTTYDPVMKRTVQLYESKISDGIQQIYGYSDYLYITSNIVTSFLTNGTDFNKFENGSLQGWSAATKTNAANNQKQHMSLVTYPAVTKTGVLEPLNVFAQIRGFLELKFRGVFDRTNGYNTFYNSGFSDNIVTIEKISAGEEYVFRIRYGYSNSKGGTPINHSGGVRAIIAKYKPTEKTYKAADDEDFDENYGYEILPKEILFDFTGNFEMSNNVISGGVFNSDYTLYIIDNIPQTPSTKYCYVGQGSNTEYIWDNVNNKFVVKPNNYLNYYHTTATARYSVSKESLENNDTKLGIFLYTNDSNLVNKYVYVEDVQITRCYRDADNNVVTIGNVPTSVSTKTDFYYLKPLEGKTSDEINTYSTLDALAQETGLIRNSIKPLYNEKCEKILSINESQSNCFNILQTLCETFECWLDLKVLHNEDGSLVLRDNNAPVKKVSFKQYMGRDNYAGFKYGINLNSIQRTIDSNEFVTKLIVDIVQSDLTDSGAVSIQNAISNPSKESYLLNFSYYLNKGLIKNEIECNNDLNNFYAALSEKNQSILALEKERNDIEAALIKSKANVSVYDGLLSEAKEKHSAALKKFKDLTGLSYDDYVRKYRSVGADSQIDDKWATDTILELIGELYTLTSTINNYSGILTNLKKEYDTLYLKSRGVSTYGINIATTPVYAPDSSSVINAYRTQITVDDYLEDFEFSLYDNNLGHVDFKTTTNDRIFTVESPPSNPYTSFVINKMPKYYRLQYFVGNREAYEEDVSNLYFIVYEAGQTISVSKRFKLVPLEDYAETYQSLSERIEKLRKEKEEIEKTFYQKYSRFIQEGTWSSNNYVDSELYYLDAVQVGRTSAQPKVSYTIEVSEVSQLKGRENYKFMVGDQTYVEDEDFFGVIKTTSHGMTVTTPIKEQVIVSTVEWHLDEPENNKITVQNYKTQFEDLFQRISATVQRAEYNEVKYPKTSAIVGTNGLIDPELLQRSWNASGAVGYNLMSDGAIVTDSEGILVQDLTNSANSVKIISRGIKVSSDGGATWLNVIDGTGINAEALTAGTINTQQIWLMDNDSPSFRWDKAGISAYQFSNDPEEPYDLTTYVRFDKYGLYGIKDDKDYVATSLEDIRDKAHFGITWDGFFIKNSYRDGYVGITSDDDFQVVDTNAERVLTIDVNVIHHISGTSKTIDLPYDNIKVDSIVDTTDMTPITNYVIEDGIIYIDESVPLPASGYEYQVAYISNPNTIDLGGSGIIEINSIVLNGEEIPEEDYSFNRDNGVLTFNKPVSPGSEVVVNYKLENIKIGALEFDEDRIPTKYGISIKNYEGETVFETSDEGNISITGNINATDGVFRGTVYARDGEFEGHIRATSGEFPGSVKVGDENENYIVISGEGDTYIASSQYAEDSQHGWMINGEGDAVFNNVSVRGAIRTSVFEYSEVQAVGGAFMFRPSDVIDKAEIRMEGDRPDLVLTMRQGTHFKVGDWCKLGNYSVNGEDISIESTGLVAIYEVIEVSTNRKQLVLKNGGELFINRESG